MNVIPTYRHGRRVYRPGPNDNGGLSGVCSLLFVAFLLVVPPALLIISESARRDTYIALEEALGSEIRPFSAGRIEVGDLVHGTFDDILAIASDGDMGVSVPGALAIRRRTEYCQWQEVRSEQCDQCARSVRASDGSVKEESYNCNCVVSYDYVKSWRGHRINSLLFDQPAAHHNPQRDPMPSVTIAAEDAVFRTKSNRGDESASAAAAAAKLDPSMLNHGVRGARWRTVNFIPNGIPPVPSFWTRWMPDRTRYEPTEVLRDILDSPAARNDRFVYVGQGGYFFSPYSSSTAENLFKYFVQYMEGSLFDWQIGDLMPSCTAGDVRFRYEVRDPPEVSVLGEVAGWTRSSDSPSEEAMAVLRPRVASNGRLVGLVHAGRPSARDMIAAEDSDSRWIALVPRLLLLPWAAASSRLLGACAGLDAAAALWPVRLAATLAVWCVALGLAWAALWGRAVMQGPFLTATAATVLGVVSARRAPKSDVPGGMNAVWCMLGRWAGVPPSWRVEKSYAGVSHGKAL